MRRNVLITGSNSGLGMHSAVELAKHGFDVYATMRNIENQTALILKAKNDGIADRIHVLQMDVNRVDSVEQVRQYFNDHHLPLHILINNAGYCEGGLFEDLSVEDYESQFQTNFFGVIRVTRAFLPLLKGNDHSQIILLSSVSGIFGFPGMSAYSASKFALEGFGESLRFELRADHIDVSLVEPASFKTKIWEEGLTQLHDENETVFKKKLYAFAMQSYHNGGDPDKVAKLIVRICQSKKAKLRYPVGKGAGTLPLFKKVFPWKWIEKAVLFQLRRDESSS